MSDSATLSPDDRLLSMKQVREIVPKNQTTIYRWIKKGIFPRGYQIGPASVAWLRSEVLQWANDHIHKPPS